MGTALGFRRQISFWFLEGKSLGLNQYRHISIAFARWHLQQRDLAEDDDEDSDDVFDAQANCSRE